MAPRLRSSLLLAGSVLLGVAAGCADRRFSATSSPASTVEGFVGGTGGMGGMGGGAAMLAPVASMADGSAPQAVFTRQESTPGPATLIPRRIIYTADVTVVTERLSELADDLARRVKAHRGYIASHQISGQAGTARSGRWKVRIPVDAFEAFLAEVSRLGEVQGLSRDSQDVSEEYTDLEARLANKRVEEARLIQHLQRSTAKLSDILAVEREISRVREEIERMTGRLRLLANQTALTTVTITATEVREYVPPRPTTFTAQIGRTFGGSLSAMRQAAQYAVLVIVAVLPWAVAAGAILFAAWWLARRRRAESR